MSKNINCLSIFVACLASGSAYAQDAEPEDSAEQVTTTLITAEELARTGGAGNRKDEDDLKALNYDDAESQLQDVPAVYIRKEDGFGLRPNIGIRGANSDRSKKITLMEDGILFGPAPYSAPAAYYFPIVSRMVGLEVFKGPAAVRYGPHTVGGAANWASRQVPYDTVAGVDLNFGSYFTGKGHAYYGTAWDHFGFLVEGVQWQSDGFKELDNGEPTGFNKTELNAKMRVNSDLSAETFHALTLSGSFAREVSHETYLGLSDADFDANPYRRYVASAEDEMSWLRFAGQARYDLEVGSAFDLRATAYRHDFDRTWHKLNNFGATAPPISQVLASPTGSRAVYTDILRGEADSATDAENLIFGNNDRRYVSQGVDLVTNWKTEFGPFSNRLRVGARLHADSIERDHTEETWAMLEGALERIDDGAVSTTKNIQRTTAYSMYLLDELSFWRLVVAPGARIELIDGELEDLHTGDVVGNSQVAVMPGIGVYGAITEELGLLAGVHRGFSPEAPGQPEEVIPESSVNYEAGARFVRPQSNTHVEVVGFFNNYSNLLGSCSFAAGCAEPTVDQQFNAGRVWVYGVEVVAGHDFVATSKLKFPVSGSYTYTGSDFRNAFNSMNPQYGDVAVGDSLPYVPEHQGAVRLGVQWQELTWNIAGTYVAPMLEAAGQGDDEEKTDAQVILDTLLSWNFFDGFTAYGKVENILGSRPIASRRPFGARPIRPRILQLGVRWEL